MCFDICIPPRQLSDALKLVQKCPDTRFVLDHCGNADPKAFLRGASQDAEEPWHDADDWKRQIGRLAAEDNVVCKISGIVARAPQNFRAGHLAPIVQHCLEEFGPDRVMFATDWPVCRLRARLRDWVEALQQIVADRSTTEQRKLFHDNAVAFYGLTS